jgi:hypothetical protein
MLQLTDILLKEESLLSVGVLMDQTLKYVASYQETLNGRITFLQSGITIQTLKIDMELVISREFVIKEL